MLLRDLQAASFKGAGFLCPEDDAEEGRNNILHRYPDSSQLYAEDNGRLPPCFIIRGLVAEPGLPGKVAKLRRAFSSPGPGVLKHPWYGTQFCAVDQTINFRRSDRHAGIVEFDVKLVVTGPPSFPGLLSGIAAAVTGLAGAAVTRMFAAFAASVGTPSTAASRAAIATAISTVGTTLEARFGSSSSSVRGLSDYSARYARNPATVADTFVSVFRAPFDDASISDVDLIKGFRDVSDVAAGLVTEAQAIEVTTADRAARQASLLVLASTVEAAAFVSLAEAMAGRAYETGDQIDADEQDLVQRFDAIQARELDADIHDALQDILTATSEVLNNLAVRLPRLATISPIGYSCSTLAYQLYHDDTNTPQDTEPFVQKLVDLNLDQDPCILTGDITVLTEV